MEQKAIQLFDRGISRDISISKAPVEFAFDNHNIRITARDHDTLLSITNERGNKPVDELEFSGVLLGWNVLNNYIILFFHDETINTFPDSIYRIKYSDETFSSIKIFQGNLNFNKKFPIESITDYESEDIMKIYWVDGRNVLRFLNFSDSYLLKHIVENDLSDNPVFSFKDDSTWFDSNRPTQTILKVDISRDSGGNTRNNGVAQYFITYYNKNGQQTGIIYSSPLVYLSPEGRGGSPDDTNSNRVIFNIENVDTTFEYIRLYQILRTSKDISNTAYLVAEVSTKSTKQIDDVTVLTVVDAGTPLETIDITSLLYLGSKTVHASTLTSKDNTLFLGDLRSVGNTGIDNIEQAIKDNAFRTDSSGKKWESDIVHFEYSEEDSNIPYITAEGYYPYENQLKYTNSKITTFKGGEKYRFAIRLYRSDGTYSKSFWIGDKVNPYYPQITEADGIKRAIAVCIIPDEILNSIGSEFTSIQLMIAKAEYSDRSVKAQGIVSPTLFNLYNRYRDMPFSQSSWIYRPKGGEYPYIHLSSLVSSTSRYSEIQSNFFGESGEPSALYYINKSDNNIINPPVGYPKHTGIKIKYTYCRSSTDVFWADIYIKFYTGESSNYEEDESARRTYIGLGNKYRGDKSLSYVISEWLKAYDDADVPIVCRLSASTIEAMFRSLNPEIFTAEVKDWFLPGGETESQDVYPIDSLSSDSNRQFASSSRAFYFVDENIVTLNSPEIENNAVNVDKNSGLKFRIVGAARLTGCFSDYDIQTENFNYIGDRVIKSKFSSNNISDFVEGLSAWPLYRETKFIEELSDESTSDADPKLIEGDIPVNYMMYMWHKSGSIPEVTYNEKKISVLNSKIFANLHYSYYSIYNNYGENEWSVGNTNINIRQADSITEQIYDISTGDIDKSYLANINDAVSVPIGVKYPIYYSPVEVSSDELPNLNTDKESQSPVPITYQSRPHAVISLPSGDFGEEILPYIFNKEAYTREQVDTDAIAGPYASWKERSIIEDTRFIFRVLNPSESISNPMNGSYPMIVSEDTFISGRGTVSARSVIQSEYDPLYTLISEGIDKGQGKPVYAILKDNSTSALYFVDVQGSNIIKANIDVVYEPGMNGNNGSLSMRFRSSNTRIMSVYYKLTIRDLEERYFDPEGEILYPTEEVTLPVPVESGYDYEYIINDIPDYMTPRQAVIIMFSVYFGHSVPVLTTPEKTLTTYAFNRATWSYEKIHYFFVQNADAMKLSELPSGTIERFLNLNDRQNIQYSKDTNTFSITEKEYTEGEPMPVQNKYILESPFLQEGNKYLFLGELYIDYDSMSIDEDTRYGGISESAVESNIFIPAGPKTAIEKAEVEDELRILQLIGNEGDTFFQRWDSVKTLPRSSDDINQVVDIASVMIETHINLDGRFDLNRGDTHLAHIDWTSFGKLNPVYSQSNDFQIGFDLDEAMDLDTYRSSITWSLEKNPNAEIDEWTHIPLTSSLKLDGDKGNVRALRRFNNSILSFQDKGIAEILFNSRTQISTQEGVPIEVANSGKVEGKRYISTKYGVTNKWSIVEGKSGLFFIDNINKIIGVFNGEGIESISTKAQIDTWVREHNSVKEWNPDDDDAVVSFYDKIHSDIYFINSNNKSQSCLVYNEILGGFVGFYDYSNIPMMVNVEDRFVSFHKRAGSDMSTLWLQNEGLFCNFFGEDKPFWITWRVTPDNMTDKIWTNIEYRADFISILNHNGEMDINESDFIDGCTNIPISNETFDTLEVWNEYQTTGEIFIPAKRSMLQRDIYPDTSRKFRIWRMDIPRATRTVMSGNRFGLDRIRNPWVYVKLKKNEGNFGCCMMQLHDVIVKYFNQK